MDEDRKAALANLELLNNGQKGIEEFTEQELRDMQLHNHPYMSKVSNSGAETYVVSINNLREDYLTKYLLTSVIGYLGQAIEEYGVPKGEYPEETHKMNEEELLTKFIEENLVDGKPSLRQYADVSVAGGEVQQPFETTRNKLKRYFMAELMRDLFVFNPNRHIRSAYEEPGQEEAAEAKKLKADGVPKSKVGLREPLKHKSKRAKRQRSRVGAVDQPAIEKLHRDKQAGEVNLSREEVENLLKQQQYSNHQEFIRLTEMIPPVDLFERFRIYRSVHYPAIKEAVHTLYRERPDWEYSINIHESFRGENQEEQVTKWIDRNESMITMGVNVITKGAWTVLAATSENRQRMTFGSKKNRVIQDMIKQHEADARIGEEMKEKRRRDDRKLNEEQAGKAAGSIKRYRKEMGNDAIKEISQKERDQLNAEGVDARGRSCEVANKYGAIQMDEIHLNPKSGSVSINHLFLESEAPDAESVGIIAKEN